MKHVVFLLITFALLFCHYCASAQQCASVSSTRNVVVDTQVGQAALARKVDVVRDATLTSVGGTIKVTFVESSVLSYDVTPSASSETEAATITDRNEGDSSLLMITVGRAEDSGTTASTTDDQSSDEDLWWLWLIAVLIILCLVIMCIGYLLYVRKSSSLFGQRRSGHSSTHRSRSSSFSSRPRSRGATSGRTSNRRTRTGSVVPGFDTYAYNRMGGGAQYAEPAAAEATQFARPPRPLPQVAAGGRGGFAGFAPQGARGAPFQQRGRGGGFPAQRGRGGFPAQRGGGQFRGGRGTPFMSLAIAMLFATIAVVVVNTQDACWHADVTVFLPSSVHEQCVDSVCSCTSQWTGPSCDQPVAPPVPTVPPPPGVSPSSPPAVPSPNTTPAPTALAPTPTYNPTPFPPTPTDPPTPQPTFLTGCATSPSSFNAGDLVTRLKVTVPTEATTSDWFLKAVVPLEKHADITKEWEIDGTVVDRHIVSSTAGGCAKSVEIIGLVKANPNAAGVMMIDVKATNAAKPPLWNGPTYSNMIISADLLTKGIAQLELTDVNAVAKSEVIKHGHMSQTLRIYGRMRTTTNQETIGVHAYIESWKNMPYSTLAIRISNSHIQPNVASVGQVLGDVYFQDIKLSLGKKDGTDLDASVQWQRYDSNVTGNTAWLVRPLPEFTGGSANRNAAVRMAQSLGGMAFATDGPRNWADTRGFMPPNIHNLRMTNEYANNGIKGHNGLCKKYSSFYGNTKNTWKNGVSPGTGSFRLNASGPFLVPYDRYGGGTGGEAIHPFPGWELCPDEFEEMDRLHNGIVNRQRGVLYDANGYSISAMDWPGGNLPFNAKNAVFHDYEFFEQASNYNGPGVGNECPYTKGNGNKYNPPAGSPGWLMDNLKDWQPIDGQHFIRASKDVIGLTLLLNDPLSKDDLEAMANTVILHWGIQTYKPPKHTGHLQKEYNQYAIGGGQGKGYSFGRANAWCLYTAVAAYMSQSTVWRDKNLVWFERNADAIIGGYNKGTGILQRSGSTAMHEKQCIIYGYDGTQIFENLFALLASYSMAEQVFAEGVSQNRWLGLTDMLDLFTKSWFFGSTAPGVAPPGTANGIYGNNNPFTQAYGIRKAIAVAEIVNGAVQPFSALNRYQNGTLVVNEWQQMGCWNGNVPNICKGCSIENLYPQFVLAFSIQASADRQMWTLDRNHPYAKVAFNIKVKALNSSCEGAIAKRMLEGASGSANNLRYDAPLVGMWQKIVRLDP